MDLTDSRYLAQIVPLQRIVDPDPEGRRFDGRVAHPHPEPTIGLAIGREDRKRKILVDTADVYSQPL